jgi:hypothetical protein
MKTYSQYRQDFFINFLFSGKKSGGDGVLLSCDNQYFILNLDGYCF